MFNDARLKLTAFYLAILLGFCLTLTIGIRLLAQHEFEQSDYAQRHEVRRLFGALVGPPPEPDAFNDVQQDEDSLVEQHLNDDLIMLNLGALVIGGVLSYWYAGRTLKPIIDAHDAQKRFASDASHELRTPLANMQVENEVFLRQGNFTEDEARALIASNLEEVQRLESLATNLLQLTQYDQADLELMPIAMRKVVNDALNHSAKALERRKVKVDAKIDAGVAVGDHESMERLLAIIIDNAIKYGPEKGTVFVTGKKTAAHYLVKIRDQGPGIVEHDLPYIFDRLYRGDKSRGKTEGYGLGLSLAKQIAIANHANITAQNSKGGGAEFTLEFGLAK